MTIKHSVLAILAQSSCYGNQLRAEFERRTARMWPVNVGQIYNTLERLERDGFVTRGAADEHGHVAWHITDAGRHEADVWLTSATPRTDVRDELAAKVSLAISLPGIDALALVKTELRAARARLAEATRTHDADPNALSALVHLAAVHRANADVQWLSAVHDASATGLAEPSAVDTQRPRRGRPKKTVATLAVR